MEPSRVHSVIDHVSLLKRHLENKPPLSTTPHFVLPGPPTSESSRVISFDLETYGACVVGFNGESLPEQTVFHPTKSFVHDKPTTLVLTASVTEVIVHDYLEGWPRFDTATEGPTRVFILDSPKAKADFAAWIEHASFLLGQNLPFDVSYSRAMGIPISRRTHKLIDNSVVNYLENEQRTEKSLKDIGPVIGTHSYDTIKTLRGGERFAHPYEPKFIYYNGFDSHVSALSIIELAKRISRIPNTGKLLPYCLNHFSEALWLSVIMSEAGIAYDEVGLGFLWRLLLTRTNDLNEESKARFDIPMQGKNSNKKRYALMRECFEVSGLPLKEVEHTPKEKKISFGDQNRNLFQNVLPKDHPLQDPLRLLGRFQSADKLLGTYTIPRLFHRRNDPEDKGACLVYGFAYPNWSVVPAFVKDGEGGHLGTVQGRITAKNPAIQTDPPIIKGFVVSRWRWGYIIWMDLSQIEMRAIALMSGDEELIRIFREKGDLHTSRAIRLFGPDIVHHPEFKSKYRQAGKTDRFALVYLAQPKTRKDTILRDLGLDIPLDTFERIDAEESGSGMRKWQTDLIEQACRDKRIELPLTGHSRYFSGTAARIKRTYSSTIVDLPPQVIAANTLLHIQFELMDILGEENNLVKQFGNIYDAVGLDSHPTRVDDAVAALEEAIRRVESPTGYWGRLQAIYGREVPLGFELKVITPRERYRKMWLDGMKFRRGILT